MLFLLLFCQALNGTWTSSKPKECNNPTECEAKDCVRDLTYLMHGHVLQPRKQQARRQELVFILSSKHCRCGAIGPPGVIVPDLVPEPQHTFWPQPDSLGHFVTNRLTTEGWRRSNSKTSYSNGAELDCTKWCVWRSVPVFNTWQAVQVPNKHGRPGINKATLTAYHLFPWILRIYKHVFLTISSPLRLFASIFPQQQNLLWGL